MVQQCKIQNQLVGRILIFPPPCSWGCSHILGNPDHTSHWCETCRLKSIAKYWHGCLEVQAGAEVCHCVKEAGLVSKIWAPDSPIFHLHWAWMGLKGFPPLQLAAVNLQGCGGKVHLPLTDGPECLKSKQGTSPNNKTLLLNLEDNFLI